MATKPIIDNSINEVRSNQDLSCNWTGTADFGRLVPISIDELIPGDKVVTCRPRIELQMLPLASPTFGKMDIYVHYFKVPIRLLWDNALDFFSQTGSGKNAVPPCATIASFGEWYREALSNSPRIDRPLYKHWTSIGLPPFFALSNEQKLTSTDRLSLLKFRAYNQIWWDFYRDPEVIRDDSKALYLDTSSGLKSAQVYARNFLMPHVRSIKSNWIANLFAQPGTTPSDVNQEPPTGLFGQEINFGAVDTTYDVAKSQDDTSRQLRLVEALTRLSERLSLSGKRQIEALFARYGVKPNFSKMQMCEYVGGAKETVLVSDITSSADTSTLDSDSGRPLGAKAASGYGKFDSLNIQCSVDEPCYLVGILSIMPHIHYVQGIDKSFYRNSLADFFQKTLEHVGNVAVSKREIAIKYPEMLTYNPSEDLDSFAYRDPYYDYKVGRDILAGDFMKYHNATQQSAEGTDLPDIQYMQSMEQYIDFPVNRTFNANNLLVDGNPYNKIFFYLGGSVFDNTDDHFHLCVDKDIIINRPMDGFAVPTIESTEDPHAKKSPLGQDTIL